MIIAQVTPVFPPYRGGIGTVAAEYERRLREKGLDVRVWHPGNLTAWYRWGHAALVPELFWRLREADVIHLHYPFYGGEIFAWLASLVWRKPLVVTYHMRPKAKGWLGAIFRLHRALLEPFILRQAKVVCVATAEYAKEHNVRHRNLLVMPFGVDTARFHPGRDDAFRQTHGIDTTVKVLIFVGGLDAAHYFKGLDVLLRACAALGNDVPWVLMVVGSGDRKEVFEHQAADLGIDERVKFVGSVPFEDLPRAYRAADAHVLPSIDRSEAFGLVTLEAAASGLPSVVSDLPGMRSQVLPGKTGLHVSPHDVARLASALRELFMNEERRAIMGAAARARAEEFYSIECLTDRLVTVYHAL